MNIDIEQLCLELIDKCIINNNYMIGNLLQNKLLKEQITPSCNQTKIWRRNQPWYENGKKNECEKYQRNLIEKITKRPCLKCNDRINYEKNSIENISRPMHRDDAFDWTEDFDGKQTFSYTLYYNLKMVCDAGGAQTRTLREVSHFINAQLKYNLLHIDNPKYFVNILDGDESYKLYSKYNYIIAKDKYKFVKNFIYIGDLFGFIDWFYTINV